LARVGWWRDALRIKGTRGNAHEMKAFKDGKLDRKQKKAAQSRPKKSTGRFGSPRELKRKNLSRARRCPKEKSTERLTSAEGKAGKWGRRERCPKKRKKLGGQIFPLKVQERKEELCTLKKRTRRVCSSS